jgi:hypothetical protein
MAVAGVAALGIATAGAPASAAPGGPSGGALASDPSYQPTAQEAALEASKVKAAANQIQPFSTGTHSKVVTLTVQAQTTSYYCVPASGRAMLTSFTSSLPSQATLASKMGTTTGGTYMSHAPAALNTWAGSFYVFDTTVGTKGGLWSRTTSDVNTNNASLMLRMEFGFTPWRNSGDTTGHAVVDYGWLTDSGTGAQELYFWDPWDSTRHVADYSVAFNDLSIGSLQMVW